MSDVLGDTPTTATALSGRSSGQPHPAATDGIDKVASFRRDGGTWASISGFPSLEAPAGSPSAQVGHVSAPAVGGALGGARSLAPVPIDPIAPVAPAVPEKHRQSDADIEAAFKGNAAVNSALRNSRRERVQKVLNRLRLQRNEKKGQWDPVQIIEHLGLDVGLKHGQFRVTKQRVRSDPLCEGVDSLKYDWRGENNWVNPPWALLDEVAHKLREEGAAAIVVARYWPVFWVDDDKFYPGVVKGFNEDGTAHVVYDDGDEENLNLSEEKFNILCSAGVSEQNEEAAELSSENIDCGGNYKENEPSGDTKSFFNRYLCGQYRSELGRSHFTDLAIQMQ
eukprot:gene1991-biopygen1882